MNASLGTITFETCRGFGLSVDVPADTVLDDVPREFGPASSVPFFATLYSVGYHCPRVAALNETLAEVGILWTSIIVLTENESWSEGGMSFYTLDVLATDPSLADRLRAVGIDARLAVLSRDALPAGDLYQESWEFSTPQATFRYHFPHDDVGSGNVLDRTFYFWNGDAPFRRVDVQVKDETSSSFHISAGAVEVEGDSRYRAALGVDRAAAVGASLYSVNWEMAARPQTFKNDG